MAAKRWGIAAGLAILLVSGLSAQWRQAAAATVTAGGDFRALAELIESEYPDLPAEEKPEAAALLAFCAKKNGETEAEGRWVIEFFESGKGLDAGFTFLDFRGQEVVSTFLNGWRMKYPWIRDIALIQGVGNEIIIPEGTLPLAVEISVPAFYKFFEGDRVIKAGAFQAGFNVLGLDANSLFRESRKRTYALEVKAGPLILKKEIVLDVTVSWPVAPKPKEPEPPKVGKLARALGTPDPPAPPPPPKVREYHLDLYVGGDLLMSSQRSETVKPLEMGLKPSNNPQFLKPDWNIKRNDPWANPGLNNRFSITDAIGLLGGLLKNLLKKQPDDPERTRIKTVQNLSLDFHLKDVEGNPLEMRVDLKLEARSRPVVRSGL
ncbi:MAG: hypothetical protein ACYDH3_07750 [Candidatus Aminicenantales bacterium]